MIVRLTEFLDNVNKREEQMFSRVCCVTDNVSGYFHTWTRITAMVVDRVELIADEMITVLSV